MEIMVYSMLSPEGKLRCLGIAKSFGEAKRMQQDSLPDDLKEAYAGIHEGHPVFYSEMLTLELVGKYPQLASEGDDT